mmetsp:Transcript_30945/g.68530  ORF Transcript_30945/g.68530 Transcript_30945/m.68530 type:complete len:288 (+) Transcript_30945:1936-2799(+)
MQWRWRAPPSWWRWFWSRCWPQTCLRKRSYGRAWTTTAGGSSWGSSPCLAAMAGTMTGTGGTDATSRRPTMSGTGRTRRDLPRASGPEETDQMASHTAPPLGPQTDLHMVDHLTVGHTRRPTTPTTTMDRLPHMSMDHPPGTVPLHTMTTTHLHTMETAHRHTTPTIRRHTTTTIRRPTTATSCPPLTMRTTLPHTRITPRPTMESRTGHLIMDLLSTTDLPPQGGGSHIGAGPPLASTGALVGLLNSRESMCCDSMALCMWHAACAQPCVARLRCGDRWSVGVGFM